MVHLVDDLPTEIIWHILSHIRTARDLVHLSLTCRRLQSLIHKDGYQLFVEHSFPTVTVPAPVEYAGDSGEFFKDAAHSLTTLSRNWDRKALIARQALPLSDSRQSRYGVRSQQTIGFIPVIDSCDAWYGGDWRDRNQVVACAAGVQLFLRSTDLAKKLYAEGPDDASRPYKPKWEIFDERGTIDGADDITWLKLVRSSLDNQKAVLLRRANGPVFKVQFSKRKGQFTRTASYDAEGNTILSLASNDDDLLAIADTNGDISIYDASQGPAQTAHVQRLPLFDSTEISKISVMEFLGPDRVIVSPGVSSSPLKVLDLEKGATTSLASSEPGSKTLCGRKVSRIASGKLPFSLAALNASRGDQCSGQHMFLSGTKNSDVHLHDLRCSTSIVATYQDNVDASPVFSLMPYGQERFVAGGGTNSCIKVFDMRVPGARRYYSTTVERIDESNATKDASELSDKEIFKYPASSEQSSGWNLFVNQNKRNRRDYNDSPVYWLSKPSDYSPTFFAGVEGRVLQIDMVSIMDRFPDPVHGRMPRTGRLQEDIRLKWGHPRHTLNLPAYEHPRSTSESVKLRRQRPIGFHKGIFHGWDERWEPV